MKVINVIVFVILFIALFFGINYLTGGPGIYKERILIENLKNAIATRDVEIDSLGKKLLESEARGDSLEAVAVDSRRIYDEEVLRDSINLSALRGQLNRLLEDDSQPVITKVTAERDYYQTESRVRGIQLERLESAYADLEDLQLNDAAVIQDQKKIIAGLNLIISYHQEQQEAYEKLLNKKGAGKNGVILGFTGGVILMTLVKIFTGG